MRTDIHESAVKLQSRRAIRVSARLQHSLEPHAVDAALSEDAPTPSADQQEDLFDSLSKQLDLLQQQEKHIRRLLARAGYVRIDNANV